MFGNQKSIARKFRPTANDIPHRMPLSMAKPRGLSMGSSPPGGWEEILRTHGPMAFDAAWRLLANAADADDAVQEAFVDAFRLYSRQAVENWGRSCVTWRRGGRSIGCAPGERPVRWRVNPPQRCAISLNPRPSSASRRSACARRWRRYRIARRPFFRCAILGNSTNPQIAEQLKITPDAVAMALHKARAKLKAALGLEQGDRKGVLP